MAKANFCLYLLVFIIGLQQVICLTQSQVDYLKMRLNDRFNLPISEYSQFSEFSETNEMDGGALKHNEYEEEKTNEINENTEEHSDTINVDIRMPDVEPTYENEYFCHAIEMPAESVYIVGYKPHAEMGTAHHMLLYGCSEPGSHSKSWNCGEMATTDDGPVCGDGPRILYAWAMDAPSLELPKDVGFEVGGDTGINYLVLQVHYGAIAEKIKEHFTDDSGITLEITDQPRKFSAAVYLLGNGGYIPGHSEVHMDSACSYDHPQVLHPFAYRVHTHKLGKVVSGYRIRNQQWEEIGRRDPQKPEMFYPITKNMTIERGDILAARCTMVNDMDKTVYTGATSDDEMCNFYMMYYTEGRLPNIDICFRDQQFKWRHYFDNIPADASVVPDEK